MWNKNRLSDLLGIQYPIIQAPMAGGATTPELVASVSNSGGLGSLGAAVMPAEDLQQAIVAIKKLTDKPFAVNLFAPEASSADLIQQQKMCAILNDFCQELDIELKPVEPPYSIPFDEQLSVIIKERVPIFSFTFGIPEQKYLDQLKEHNTKIIGTATCLQEAKVLAEIRVDAIVAQGIEAGGHRGTFPNTKECNSIGTLSLITQVYDALDLPIIAAGGIADARGVYAVLSLGAEAVQMGTAFLTTNESGIHDKYKEALLTTTHDHTQLTRAFSGRLARAIRNRFVELMENHEDAILPFPIQNKLTKQLRVQAAHRNNPDFMSLWAGQSAYLCRSISASELMTELIAQLENLKW